MITFSHHFNELAKYLKVICFRSQFRFVLLKERNDDIFKLFAISYLVTITLLMILAFIFLKVYITATEEFFELKENGFIPLDEFYIKSRLGSDSTNSFV